MVQFFNCFDVPAGMDDEFFRLWTEVNAYMIEKPGYVSHRLHRAIDDRARFRFLNHGVWQSAEHWRAAHDATFRLLLSQPAWAPFASTPALYDVVHSGSATHGPSPHSRRASSTRHPVHAICVSEDRETDKAHARSFRPLQGVEVWIRPARRA